MGPWRRHCARQPHEQTQRVEIDRDGAVLERAFERDAHQLIRQEREPLLSERRPQYVFHELLTSARVVGTGGRASVQREAELRHTERRRDLDTRMAAHAHGTALAQLGAGRRQAAHGGSRELSQRRLALAEAVVEPSSAATKTPSKNKT